MRLRRLPLQLTLDPHARHCPAASSSASVAWIAEVDSYEGASQGQYIKHYRYGMGVVTESDDRQTSIYFDVHGLKRFVTRLMVVEISDLKPHQRVRAKHGAKDYALCEIRVGRNDDIPQRDKMKTVFVGDMAFQTTEGDLRRLFEPSSHLVQPRGFLWTNEI